MRRRGAAAVFVAFCATLAPVAVASSERSVLRTNGNIAFISTRGADGTSHVYTMTPAGSAQAAVTSGSVAHSCAALAPDGRRLAVCVERSSSGSDIWVMSSDGTNVRRLTNDRRSGEPAWSPDAKRLAFTRTVQGKSHVWVMNPDGSRKRRLTTGAEAISPTWAPDGARIAFLRGGGLWVMNANGSSPRAVTKGVSVWAPAWSPDGKRFAYESTVDTSEVNPTAEIWIVNADGTHARRLTRNRVHDNHPVWSPDGTLIAFSSDRGAGSTHIFTMKPNGTRVRQLTRGAHEWAPGDYLPSWGGRP